MDEQVMRRRIGVMVLAAILVTVILLIMFGETRGLFQKTYTIQIVFSEAPGVSEGAPIRRSGVSIGKVVDVEPLDEGGVVVTAAIQERMRLRHDEVCRISANLLGDSLLNFVRVRDPQASKEIVQPGETLHGTVAPDPIAVVADMQERLAMAIGSVNRTSEDLDAVICKVGKLLDANEERINGMLAKADETMSTFRDTARNANEIIGSDHTKQQIRDSLDQVPMVLREVRSTLVKFNDTVVLMDRNLSNLEGFTRPLGERGEAVVERLNGSVEKLDRVMEQMVAFSQSLNSQEGSLGQLIHNRELYDNLNRAAINVESLSQQLRPILNDARIFTDKIARHPETLGVRGAINPSPGTKGLPTFPSPLR